MVYTSLPQEAPGEYVPYGKRPYYLPDPLPPDFEFNPSGEFRDLLRDTIYNLGKLDGIGDETDTNPLLYTTMVRREAVESVVLEGADIDIVDVYQIQRQDEAQTVTKDVQEALNYEQAITTGSKRVADTGTISLSLVRELHEILMEDVRGHCEYPGEFRPKPMNLPPANSFREQFVPPAPSRIPELMENLIQYIRTGDDHHDLIQCAIVHYQLETIHPFEDGNGRLGRILTTLQLVDRGYLSHPYLYPSAYFNQHKVEYARRMREVSEDGAWEPWLEFFVEALRTQAEEAVERTNELRDLRREYERKYGHEKTVADRLAMRLFQQPYVTSSDVVEMLDVSDQGALNAISELESHGVLAETTGKERYKEFKAVDIFEILNTSLDQ